MARAQKFQRLFPLDSAIGRQLGWLHERHRPDKSVSSTVASNLILPQLHTVYGLLISIGRSQLPLSGSVRHGCCDLAPVFNMPLVMGSYNVSGKVLDCAKCPVFGRAS